MSKMCGIQKCEHDIGAVKSRARGSLHFFSCSGSSCSFLFRGFPRRAWACYGERAQIQTGLVAFHLRWTNHVSIVSILKDYEVWSCYLFEPIWTYLSFSFVGSKCVCVLISLRKALKKLRTFGVLIICCTVQNEFSCQVWGPKSVNTSECVNSKRDQPVATWC